MQHFILSVFHYITETTVTFYQGFSKFVLSINAIEINRSTRRNHINIVFSISIISLDVKKKKKSSYISLCF